MIRKKKQVMVRYLKKDVADLLAGGHDANAIGRVRTFSLLLTSFHMEVSLCFEMICDVSFIFFDFELLW